MINNHNFTILGEKKWLSIKKCHQVRILLKPQPPKLKVIFNASMASSRGNKN